MTENKRFNTPLVKLLEEGGIPFRWWIISITQVVAFTVLFVKAFGTLESVDGRSLANRSSIEEITAIVSVQHAVDLKLDALFQAQRDSLNRLADRVNQHHESHQRFGSGISQ